MSRQIDENAIIKMLNTMDRYTSEELTLCDTDKTFPKNEVFIVDDVFEGLDELPSAEPETHEERTETHACDLPSAQPEIIRCKDCVWRDGSICRNNDTMPWSDDDFCSNAERRTDESD